MCDAGAEYVEGFGTTGAGVVATGPQLHWARTVEALRLIMTATATAINRLYIAVLLVSDFPNESPDVPMLAAQSIVLFWMRSPTTSTIDTTGGLFNRLRPAPRLNPGFRAIPTRFSGKSGKSFARLVGI